MTLLFHKGFTLEITFASKKSTLIIWCIAVCLPVFREVPPYTCMYIYCIVNIDYYYTSFINVTFTGNYRWLP